MVEIFTKDIFLLLTVAIMAYVYRKNKDTRGGKAFGIGTVAYGIFVLSNIIMRDSKYFLAVGGLSLVIIILSAAVAMKTRWQLR